MTTHIYLCTTPNQANFLTRLHRKRFSNTPCLFIRLDAVHLPFMLPQNIPFEYRVETVSYEIRPTEQDRAALVKALTGILPDGPLTCWLSFYDNDALIDCARLIREMRGREVEVRTFYESINSYLVADCIRKQWCKKGADFLAPHFLGIGEIDRKMGYESDPEALSFHELYDVCEAPDQVARADGILLGQPILEDGAMSEERYAALLEGLVSNKLIDTILMHPRSRYEPRGLKAVYLKEPVESYAGVLANKKLYTLFSSSCLYYHFCFQNVKIIDVPMADFTMNETGLAIYDWMRNHIPVVRMQNRPTSS